MVDHVLSGSLAAKHCPACEGNWIPPEAYENWRGQQVQPSPEALNFSIELEFSPAPLDAKAALCPDCHGFLSRARVGSKNPFYIERCSKCCGIWCDRNEWEILQELGLHTSVELLFSNEWQNRMKELEHADRERRATVDKLGEDLANRVFELAELLERHPNGDFGVAYLMRRFDK